MEDNIIITHRNACILFHFISFLLLECFCSFAISKNTFLNYILSLEINTFYRERSTPSLWTWNLTLYLKPFTFYVLETHISGDFSPFFEWKLPVHDDECRAAQTMTFASLRFQFQTVFFFSFQTHHLKLTALIRLGKWKKICTALLNNSICGMHKYLL